MMRTSSTSTSAPASMPMAECSLLPFDAHNHVQLGPSPAIRAVFQPVAQSESILADEPRVQRQIVSGMAIMSTHPRDYEPILRYTTSLLDECNTILSASSSSSSSSQPQDSSQSPPASLSSDSPLPLQIVPCLGVHPWFLHELSQEDWMMVSIASESCRGTGIVSKLTQQPRWVHDLECHITKYNAHVEDSTRHVHAEYAAASHPPKAIVGEFGLDKFHYHPDTKELVTDMETQVSAMEYQLSLATRLRLPVSLHCVHAMGPMMDAIKSVKKNHKGCLPPAMYFHAFGGKSASIDQLVSLCCGTSKKQKQQLVANRLSTQVFFGFAPVVNFRSPKTADVVRKVGVDRLVLETDHEDAARIPDSIQSGVEYLATALEITPEELIQRTNRNAEKLYSIRL